MFLSKKQIKNYQKDGVLIVKDIFKDWIEPLRNGFQKVLENPSKHGRENVDKNHFNNLASRITEEARRSIEIAEYLLSFEKINTHNIEIHLDVSPMHLNNGTSKFSDMLKGYVKGFGVDYRLKPDAWASQTVADKHSK
mgnify:CR=1 FL=1